MSCPLCHRESSSYSPPYCGDPGCCCQEATTVNASGAPRSGSVSVTTSRFGWRVEVWQRLPSGRSHLAWSRATPESPPRGPQRRALVRYVLGPDARDL